MVPKDIRLVYQMLHLGMILGRWEPDAIHAIAEWCGELNMSVLNWMLNDNHEPNWDHFRRLVNDIGGQYTEIKDNVENTLRRNDCVNVGGFTTFEWLRSRGYTC